MKAKEAIAGYIIDELLPKLISPSAPTKQNLEKGFRDYMVGLGVRQTEAEENSTRWKPQLLQRLEHILEEWERGGIPRPAATSIDQGDILVTWKHSKYEELTGLSGLSEEYVSIYVWLSDLKEKDFLFACICLLKIMGAEKIYITDGKGDEGIDCIGRIGNGPLHSSVILVQSKTVEKVTKLISRDLLLSEYGKYLALPHSKTYEDYRRVLDIDASVDGVNYCYLVVSNGEFHYSGQKISSKIGILLRSLRQIAYWLSQSATLVEYEKQFKVLKGRLKRDLTYDYSNDLVFIDGKK